MKKEKVFNPWIFLVLMLAIAIMVTLSIRAFSAQVTWTLSSDARIIWVETADSRLDDEALTEQIQLFDSELAKKIGTTALPIFYGDEFKAQEGDIRLVLDSSNGIAEQGFKITLSDGMVTVSASDADGLFYGCRDLIQQLLLNGSVSAKSDAPDVLERAVSLDNGRKYFSVDEIKKLIREMSWCKMNALALHFSEEMGLGIESKRYTWLAGRDGTLCVAASISSDSRVLSHEDIAEIVAYADLYHVDIIPSFDSPGHMNYVVKKFNAKCKNSAYSFVYNGKKYTAKKGTVIGNYFHYNNKTAIVQGSRNTSYSRGIDISNEVAVAFTKSLIEEYATLFAELGCTKFDIGGDELLGWGASINSSVSKWKQLDHWKSYAQNKTGNSKAVAYDAFLLYMNDLNDLVRGLGYKSVRMWNDDALRSSDTGWTGVVKLDKDIDIWYWTASANSSKNTVLTYVNNGYQVYNILSDYNYYVMNDEYYSGNRGDFSQAYANQIYNEWNPYVFDPNSTTLGTSKNTVAGNPNVLGSGFGIWCDKPSLKTGSAVINGALPLIRAHAAKAWNYQCNNSVNYTSFTQQLNKLGAAPADPASLPAAPDVIWLHLEALNEKVTVFKSVSADAYTQESYTAYAVAVENAQTLAKNVYTTQAELDAAVQQIATVKALLRSADDISDKNMLVSVTSRSTQVLRGQTVTLSVVASECISGVEIYDDLGNRVAVDQFVNVANSTDERDIVVLQFIESTPGSRTYRVYAVDAEGKRSADYLECSVTCY